MEHSDENTAALTQLTPIHSLERNDFYTNYIEFYMGQKELGREKEGLVWFFKCVYIQSGEVSIQHFEMWTL